MAHLVGKADAKMHEIVRKVRGPHGPHHHHPGGPRLGGGASPHAGGGAPHMGAPGPHFGGPPGPHVGGGHGPAPGGHPPRGHHLIGGPANKIKHTVRGGIHKLAGHY